MTLYSWDKGTGKYISSSGEVMGGGKATKDSSGNWTLNNGKSTTTNTSKNNTTTTGGSNKGGTSGGSSGGGSGGSSGSSSGSSSSSKANGQYRGAGGTGLTDTDWGTKYANNSTIQDMIKKYGQNNVYDALDYISTTGGGNKSQINYLLSGGGSTDLKKDNTINYNANGSQLKSSSSSTTTKSPLTESQVISTISNMKFGKDVNKGYDMTSRNSQIADTMKQMGLDVKDATSVQDFLEKYAPSYKAASDNDKINTANRIFELYSNYQPTTDETPINNESPIVDEAETGEEGLGTNFDELLGEILGEEGDEAASPEGDTINGTEDEYADDSSYEIDEDTRNYISGLEDQIENLNSQLDSLSSSKVEPYDAEKAAKEARQAALEEGSAAAWNRASGEGQQEEAPQVNEEEQALTSTANYGTYGNKIMNSLSRLGYGLDSGDTNTNEGNMDAVLSGGEPEPTVEEQQGIAEAEGGFIPSFPNSMELVNNYVGEIDKIAEMGPSKENVEKALKIYLDAKDAAAYYVAHNKGSNQEYNDMLRQIKRNPNFINLLNNFRGGGMKK